MSGEGTTDDPLARTRAIEKHEGTPTPANEIVGSEPGGRGLRAGFSDPAPWPKSERQYLDATSVPESGGAARDATRGSRGWRADPLRESARVGVRFL